MSTSNRKPEKSNKQTGASPSVMSTPVVASEATIPAVTHEQPEIAGESSVPAPVPVEPAVTGESTIPEAGREPVLVPQSDAIDGIGAEQSEENPESAESPTLDSGVPSADDNAAPEVAVEGSTNPVSVAIFPLRTYHDAGELKRRGGPSYLAPRLHAKQLIDSGLATDKNPKA